jgi:methylamine dehydrogenase accessory protein MauD
MPIGWAVVIVVQWLAIVALAAIVLGVLRQATPHLEKLAESPPSRRLVDQGPAIGSKLPPFTAHDRAGQLVHAAELLGGPNVLLFMSATCPPCAGLAEELRVADLGEFESPLVIVIDAADDARLRLPARLGVLHMTNREVGQVFGVSGRPFAVITDADGVVRAKRGLNTVDQLKSLAARFVPSVVTHDRVG